MYGAIIGDIVGSRFEGNPHKSKVFELFTNDCAPTDDSVLTVAVADAIMADNDFEYYLRHWGVKYPYAGYGGTFIHWLANEIPAYNSYGNGSAMRVSPIGWAYHDLETTRKMARKSAEVTHNHPEGIKGAESVASAIWMARTGKSKSFIKNYIEKEFGYDLSRKVNDIRKTYKFDVTCQGSVPEAIICFLESVSFEDAIRNAVSLGGDSDTQAAIAGSIAEAYYGIPHDLIRECNRYLPDDMREVVDDFYIYFIPRLRIG